MDILVDNERMNSIIEFWQKKYADAEAENGFLKKELECSINLRKQIQNDLLKSDRLNDKLEAKNTELKAENEKLKSQIKDLQIRKDRYYLKGLEQERQISDYITILQDIKEIAKHEIKELTDSAINGGRYLEILDLITKRRKNEKRIFSR